MKLKVFAGSAFLVLTGCVTVTPIVGPDGTENQLIACLQIEKCYNKAREVCSGNYKIVNANSETSGDKNYVATETKLLIKCDR